MTGLAWPETPARRVSTAHSIHWTDALLVGIVGAGLFLSALLPAIFLLLPLRLVAGPRATWSPVRWHGGHVLLALSTGWAMLVILQRGTPESTGLLLQHLFLWTLPFYMAAYRPDAGTLRAYQGLVLLVFVADLAFNLMALALGADPLGRALDERESVAGSRLGGLFAHSFYSGSISMLAYAGALAQRRWGLALLCVLNLLLAGSMRLYVAALLMPCFLWAWTHRSRWREAGLIVAAAVAVLLAIAATSTVLGFVEEGNPANDLRLVAWLTALEKIDASPWWGVGWPGDRPEDGMNFEAIDDLLITESWHLTAWITYGLPYYLLRFGGLVWAFYSAAVWPRSRLAAALIPVTLVDLTYGGLLEGTLFYVYIWLLCSLPRSDGPAPERSA